MASAVRPRFVPPPFQDAAEQGRLILRDGSTATIRVSRPEDEVFFDGLSPESRRRRFFSAAPPVPELITSLSDSSDPSSALTLLVIRTSEALRSRAVGRRPAVGRPARTPPRSPRKKSQSMPCSV